MLPAVEIFLDRSRFATPLLQSNLQPLIKSCRGTKSERTAVVESVDRMGRTFAVLVDHAAYLSDTGYANPRESPTLLARRTCSNPILPVNVASMQRQGTRDSSAGTALQRGKWATHLLKQVLAPSLTPTSSAAGCEMRRTASSIPCRPENIFVTARARKGGSDTMLCAECFEPDSAAQ